MKFIVTIVCAVLLLTGCEIFNTRQQSDLIYDNYSQTMSFIYSGGASCREKYKQNQHTGATIQKLVKCYENLTIQSLNISKISEQTTVIRNVLRLLQGSLLDIDDFNSGRLNVTTERILFNVNTMFDKMRYMYDNYSHEMSKKIGNMKIQEHGTLRKQADSVAFFTNYLLQ